MKLVLALCLLGVALAAPPPFSYSSDSKNATIVRYDYDNAGLESYKYDFEQSDGTKHELQVQLVNKGFENQYVKVKGTFKFIGTNGVTYVVTYVAAVKEYEPEFGEGPGGVGPDIIAASLLG